MRVGVDVLERVRIARVLARERWRRVLFTAGELEPTGGYGPERAAEYLAGRFSAKEAVAKVLGVGFFGPLAWRDIEVLRSPCDGAPTVALHRYARVRAEALGLRGVSVSISHQPTVVVAFAVGEGAPAPACPIPVDCRRLFPK